MKSSLDEPICDLVFVPFYDVFEAIRFLNQKNPARMKCKNVLEDSRENPVLDPLWVWTQVLYAAEDGLRQLPAAEQRHWYRGYRCREPWDLIAHDAGVSVRTIKRRMGRINETIETSLKKRGILA